MAFFLGFISSVSSQKISTRLSGKSSINAVNCFLSASESESNGKSRTKMHMLPPNAGKVSAASKISESPTPSPASNFL